MENEKENGYGAGEGQGPDYHTDNREPVIVAEQPAREPGVWRPGCSGSGRTGAKRAGAGNRGLGNRGAK